MTGIVEILHECIPKHSWWWVEEQDLEPHGRGVRRLSWDPGRSVVRGGQPLFDMKTGKPIYTGYNHVNKSPGLGFPPLSRIGWKPSEEDKAATDWVWCDPE